MTTTTSHPFTHCGPAPYRFVGATSLPSNAAYGRNPEAGNNRRAMAAALLTGKSGKVGPGAGTCACCGMAIMNIFVIEAGNGERFGVGCDCVLKVNQEPKLVSDVKRAKKQMDTERRKAREAAKLAMLNDLLADEGNRAALADQLHPRGFKDRETGAWLTFLDYADWMQKNSGTSGKLRLLKAVERALSPLERDVATLAKAIREDHEEREKAGRPQDPPRRCLALRESWTEGRYEIASGEYETRRMIECERNSIEHRCDPQR